MTHIVSITSRGQINIPISIRDQLIFPTQKASLSIQKGKIIIEPLKDLLSLKGSISSQKKFNPIKSREAFGAYLADQSR